MTIIASKNEKTVYMDSIVNIDNHFENNNHITVLTSDYLANGDNMYFFKEINKAIKFKTKRCYN